jgi:toxin ParE1/3/4
VNLVVTPEAAADLKRLRAFLETENPTAAAKAAEVIRHAIRSLEAFPERGRPSPIAGMRDLIAPFGRSAYVVRYSYIADAGTIVIVRIWHGREDRPVSD